MALTPLRLNSRPTDIAASLCFLGFDVQQRNLTDVGGVLAKVRDSQAFPGCAGARLLLPLVGLDNTFVRDRPHVPLTLRSP